MAQPTMKSFAASLYAAMADVAKADPSLGYPLAYYLNGIGEMFQVDEDYGRDQLVGTVFAPGWSQLLDLSRAPIETLPWLAQFVGVSLPQGLTEAQQRSYISGVGGWNRGTVASMVAAAQQFLTGTKTVVVRERDASVVPANPAYGLTIITRDSETPLASAVENSLILSGNEITDAARAGAATWGTGQLGGSIDHRTVPSGMGIWPARTNLYRRGQNDSTADIVTTANSVIPSATVTVSVDATVPVVTPGGVQISPQSIKVIHDGTLSNQGVYFKSAAGQAAPAGTDENGGCWFKGTAGGNYLIRAFWQQDDGSLVSGLTLSLTVTGNWQWVQLLTLNRQAVVGVGRTGDIAMFQIRGNGTFAGTFWVGNAQIESFSRLATPYIATSGGNTATRAAARVQGPANLISAAQGWVAIRYSPGYSGTLQTYGAYPNAPTYFYWADDANNYIRLCYDDTNNVWTIERKKNGVGTFRTFSGGATTVNTDITVVAYWTPTQLGISTGGFGFNIATNTNVPDLAAQYFDIGSMGGIQQAYANLYWVACGKGTLSTADQSTLNALGNTLPGLHTLPRIAQVTGIFPMVTNAITRVTDDQAKVLAALLGQKPAGIILNYQVLTGTDYQGLFTGFATYGDIFSTFTTYEGVLDLNPGH